MCLCLGIKEHLVILLLTQFFGMKNYVMCFTVCDFKLG